MFVGSRPQQTTTARIAKVQKPASGVLGRGLPRDDFIPLRGKRAEIGLA
jgi:hypothetical protein